MSIICIETWDSPCARNVGTEYKLSLSPRKSSLFVRTNTLAMDFVSDSLANGQNFRACTLVDQHTRECPAIEVGTSLPSLRVIRVLERLAQQRGLPEEITCDNGPDFVSRRLPAWCAQKGVLPLY